MASDTRGRGVLRQPEMQYFGVCKDHIRQIEAKALRKLRHPSRSLRLKEVFEIERPADKDPRA